MLIRAVCVLSVKTDQIKELCGTPQELQADCVTHLCVTPLESWEIDDVGLGAC